MCLYQLFKISLENQAEPVRLCLIWNKMILWFRYPKYYYYNITCCFIFRNVLIGCKEIMVHFHPPNRYDHLVDIVQKLLSQKPPDVVDNFEQYSWEVKQEKFKPNFDLLNDLYMSPPQMNLTRSMDQMFRVPVVLTALSKSIISYICQVWFVWYGRCWPMLIDMFT